MNDQSTQTPAGGAPPTPPPEPELPTIVNLVTRGGQTAMVLGKASEVVETVERADGDAFLRFELPAGGGEAYIECGQIVGIVDVQVVDGRQQSMRQGLMVATPGLPDGPLH